jgi:hypothetical protein
MKGGLFNPFFGLTEARSIPSIEDKLFLNFNYNTISDTTNSGNDRTFQKLSVKTTVSGKIYKATNFI